MKRISIIITSLLYFLSGTYAQSPNQNYIRTRTMTESDASKYIEEIQYFDGLGRPMQTVQCHISPAKADMVSYQGYDVCNRESDLWLPVVASGNNGAFVSLSSLTSKSLSAYSNDTKAYSKPVYESSPLSRILEQYSPGEGWHNNGKRVQIAYLSNNTAYPCKHYTTTDNLQTVSIARTSSSTNYSNAELYVTKHTDEDGNISYEFKDKLGQVVLTRQMDGSTAHDTYYVYDSYGNLRAVLPSLAADNLQSGTWTESNTCLQQYAYLYKYDTNKRCIEKKLPGCAPVKYRYDKAGRLIFTQDGEMYSKGVWMFSIPDVFGRIVLTGTTTQATEIANMIVNASRSNEAGNLKGYLLPNGFELPNMVIHSVNYYDDYTFLGHNNIPNTTETQYNTEPGYGACYGDHQAINKFKSKGLPTGRLTAQLTENGVADTYLYTVMYYDYRGRIIQSKSTNHLTAGIEKEYILYTFTGQVKQRKHIHSATGENTQTEVYTYTYDHAERLASVKHKLNSNNEVTLAANTYDELGRLKSSQRNGQTALTTNYTYNIRSWVKSISTGNLFSQTLYYNDSYGGNKPCYNGNISAMSWTVPANNVIKGYRFAYDSLSRLTSADYLENGVANSHHNTSYTYDKHGNITDLTRSGHTGTSTYGIVDNLAMTYNGNQLIKVTDTGTTPSISTSADFRSGSAASVQYFYDANGNLKQDLNKGIGNIAYNSLNLPSSFTISNSLGSATNTYVYSADGRKLKVTKGTFTTDYVGNVIYENNVLKRILVDGGYYENGTYYFYLTDHLGNNRVVTNQSGAVIQSTQYYPFGMAFADGTNPSAQPYKFGGKELESDRGLNLYDFHARWQDAALGGRFLSVDPLAEKYYSVSPYVYCMNNPVRFVDLEGDSVRVYTETQGFGHTWISTGEGDNMVVYSYGRYNGTNKENRLSNGPGVLLKLTGEEAKSYNEEKASTGMSVFIVTDVTDETIANTMDKIFDSSITMPDNPNSKYFNDPSAHVVDEYKLTSNNCTTVVSDVLNNNGSSALKGSIFQQTSNFGTWKTVPVTYRFVLPSSMQNYLNKISHSGGTVYKTR